MYLISSLKSKLYYIMSDSTTPPHICNICLDALSLYRITYTPCIHGFHTKCIMRWVYQNINNITPVICPICKTDISILALDANTPPDNVLSNIVDRSNELHNMLFNTRSRLLATSRRLAIDLSEPDEPDEPDYTVHIRRGV